MKLEEYAEKRANDVYDIDINELKQLVIDGANWMKDNIKLYEFLYNPMTEESGYVTMSIHKTKEGAEKAMKEHKDKEKAEWDKIYENEDIPFKFGRFEDWRIEEVDTILE